MVRGFRALAWALSVCLASGSGAHAADPQPRSRDILFFSGVDLSTVSNFAWIGTDAPLMGPRDKSGPILRLVGGAGRYDYTASGVRDGHVNGEVMAGEFLAGWRILRPGMWGAVLAGLEVEDHTLDRIDPDNEVQGQEIGVRVAGEFSWKPDDHSRIDVSGAYGSAFDLYRARLAGSYELLGSVLTGLEGETFQNTGSDQQRLGLFFENVHVGPLALKASAGALYDDDGIGAYGRFGADIYW